MDANTITLIVSISSPIITVLGIYLNNILQANKDFKKAKMEETFYLKKDSIERQKEHYKLIKFAISKIHMLLSEIEDQCTLTSSYIDLTIQLSQSDYNKSFKSELKNLRKLRMLVDLYYPEFQSRIDKICGISNKYWGYQQSLLLNDSKNDKDHYLSIDKKIIELQSELGGIIQSIKLELIEKNRELDKKYLFAI